jgi:CDP-paratose 2-epimerase
MLEAIDACERIAGRPLSWERSDEARVGDHRWWISDLSEFQSDYPDWAPRYGIEDTLREIYEENVERWSVGAR